LVNEYIFKNKDLGQMTINITSGTSIRGNISVNLQDIVKDGLVLWLDAGNRTSYPGSGTTWTDLSGNGNHGTLTNGPTFDSANGGNITFDGTDDYVNIGVNKSCNRFTGDFAVSVWVNKNSAGVYGNIIGDYYTTLYEPLEWQLYITNNTPTQIGLYNNTGGLIIGISTGYNVENWINLVITRTGSTISAYANTNLLTSVTNTTTFGSATGNLNIGIDGDNATEALAGKIANVLIYKNKGLSASEIYQNYYALKSRFGL
jgi:hypothetical protein